MSQLRVLTGRHQGQVPGSHDRKAKSCWRSEHSLFSDADIHGFHVDTHTYRYKLQDGGRRASCRLDRWYVSTPALDRVDAVMTTSPCANSDHDGVLLLLTQPNARREIPGRPQPRRLRYPLPAYAKSAMHEVSQTLLSAAQHALGHTPDDFDWDDWKQGVRRDNLAVRHRCAQKLKASWKQRMRRLRAALRNAELHLLNPAPPQRATVDDITDALDRLALDPGPRADLLRADIVALQQQRSKFRRNRMFERYTGRDHVATRAFYQRFSNRTPSARTATVSRRSLRPQGRLSTQLAEDWKPILQQKAPEGSAMEAFFAGLPPRSQTPDLRHLTAPFTEAEIRAAIEASPRGKASGPDGNPNDWYRDHVDELVPLLARLYSLWLSRGSLPRSIKEASIYCIPKTATPRSGLDYRPIALLNSDYKIFSRLLLTRVQAVLVSLVSPTQSGFVGGRQVHDAVDVWSAVQKLVQQGALQRDTLVVLLDFAKAYDMLDRDILRRALERHGFPPDFVHIIHDMHLATTAAFLGEGDTSDPVDVFNGIRQGCPLAPVLFVLALDLLYDVAAGSRGVPGVRLTRDVTVRLAGFADDTSAYLNHPS